MDYRRNVLETQLTSLEGGTISGDTKGIEFFSGNKYLFPTLGVTLGKIESGTFYRGDILFHHETSIIWEP